LFIPPVIDTVGLQPTQLGQCRGEHLAAIEEAGLPPGRHGIAAKERGIERHACLHRQPLIVRAIQ
jgi:hypothetical protein